MLSLSVPKGRRLPYVTPETVDKLSSDKTPLVFEISQEIVGLNVGAIILENLNVVRFFDWIQSREQYSFQTCLSGSRIYKLLRFQAERDEIERIARLN